MAIVQSLFGGMGGGMSEAAMQQQLDAQRAAEVAQLTPNQMYAQMAYQGGAGLTRGIGGLLGADTTDPTIRQATQIRQLASQFDTNTSAGMAKFAAALRQVNPEASFKAAQQAQSMQMEQAKLESEKAQTLQRTAAATKETKINYGAEADRASRAKYGKDFSELTKEEAKVIDDLLVQRGIKETKTSYGVEADRAAKAKYNKNFTDLTQAEAKVIDDLLEERGIKKAKAGVLPGVKGAGDVTGLRKDLQALTKPYQDQADAAGDAIDLASMAIKTNNFAAVSSLSRSLAKAAGETQLSGKDVEAFGIDPSLVGSLADTATRLAKGRPTVDTLTKLRQLAEALKKKAESRISIEEQQLQDTARVSGQFSAPQIETVFRRRPAQGSPQAGNTSFNSIQDAEAAKLPKGTIITINGRRAVVE